jgi:hypothetical protein
MTNGESFCMLRFIGFRETGVRHSLTLLGDATFAEIESRWRYTTIITPVVLYGCETWSLTLREEHKQRVFENRASRRIFGPKRDGVTGGWRKLHNEELHDLYSSPNIIRNITSRTMRWVGHVARMGGEEERV